MTVTSSPSTGEPARPPQTAGQLAAVTFSLGGRQVDVLVPTDLPLTQIMPRVLDLVQDGGVDDAAAAGSPASWAVAPVGSPPLDWHSTLAQAGIRDGDTLFLATHSRALRGAAVHDVATDAAAHVDLLGDRFDRDQARWWWSTALTIPAAGAVLAELIGLRIGWVWLVVVGVAALAASVLQARPWAQPSDPEDPGNRQTRWSVPTLVAGGSVPLLIAAWQASPDQPWARFAITGAAAAAIGVAGLVPRTAVSVTVALLTVGTAALLVAAIVAAGGSATLTTVIIAAVAYLAVGAAPQVAISAGGLWSLELLIKDRSVDRDQVNQAIESSTLILSGLLFGLGLIGAACVAALADLRGDARPWQLGLAGLLTVGLLIRSRAFSRRAHVWALRWPLGVGAILAVAQTALSLGEATAVICGCLCAGWAWTYLRWPAHLNARGRLLLNAVETALTIGLVPVAFGAAGFFGWLGDRL